MKIKAPIRDLIRHSIALSNAITILAFILIYIQDAGFWSSLYRAVLGGFSLLITSAISITLIIILDKVNCKDVPILNKLNCNDENKLSKLRFVLGFFLNMFLTAILFKIGSSIARKYSLFSDHMYEYGHSSNLHGWEGFFLLFIPTLMIYALVHLIHNAILLQYQKAQTDLEVSILRSANAEASNQLLRQQVQPHFLFNALSVLKSLIRTDTKTAENYLVNLSDFLRMSFAQNEKDTASIKEEIKLCHDYLEMQKIRFGEALEYKVEVPEQYMEYTLPFFALQTLAENAIKHNKLTIEKPLHIRIYVKDETIIVENNLQRKPIVEDSNGYGLPNLSERYQLLTGNDIDIREDADTFSVGFKIA